MNTKANVYIHHNKADMLTPTVSLLLQLPLPV